MAHYDCTIGRRGANQLVAKPVLRLKILKLHGPLSAASLPRILSPLELFSLMLTWLGLDATCCRLRIQSALALAVAPIAMLGYFVGHLNPRGRYMFSAIF